MKSSIFYTIYRQELELKVKELLNNNSINLSEQTAQSTRAVGDTIEEIVAIDFASLIVDKCSDYQSGFARRAMADLAFKDIDGFNYIVDVKTHRVASKFSMPSLTSVERLARLYEDDTNYFALLLIKYSMSKTTPVVSDVCFLPIEFIGWDCLTIGALGWGQIQIKDSNVISINDGYSRKRWMLELCDAMSSFYPKEVAKISQRLDYFEKVRRFWQDKPEA